MPPKKSTVAKGEVAKKQKQVEDKTFGLKNKNKSKQVQKYVQQMNQSVENVKKQHGMGEKDAAKKKREAEAARDKELNDIFKVAITQPKVPVGVDPKSIVCEFFRRGQCTKGFKCKFSHDLSVERKSEKIDLYTDKRDGEDTMEDWDQAKLEEVVSAKGAEYKNSNRPTDIVCKHFLDAVEKKQYGWFWSCPNGGKECMYRHALPPGYVLKSQMKQLLEEESANKVTIEEEIEQRRHSVKTTTPLTTELFAEWKQKKAQKKEEEMAAKRADRVKQDRMSGRELFTHDASLFVDDEDGYAAYERDAREEEEEEEESGAPSQSQTQEAQGNGHSRTNQSGAGPSTSAVLTEEDEAIFADDDDELDLDELDELEEHIAKTALEERKEGGGSSGT